MTPVSKRKLDAKVDAFLEKLSKNVFKDLNSSEASLILSTLFTETEQEMFKKRLGIILLIGENYGITDIANITKTTLQTVERIKMQLRLTSQKDKNLLVERLKAEFLKENIAVLLKDAINVDISRSSFRRKLSRL